MRDAITLASCPHTAQWSTVKALLPSVAALDWPCLTLWLAGEDTALVFLKKLLINYYSVINRKQYLIAYMRRVLYDHFSLFFRNETILL